MTINMDIYMSLIEQENVKNTFPGIVYCHGSFSLKRAYQLSSAILAVLLSLIIT